MSSAGRAREAQNDLLASSIARAWWRLLASYTALGRASASGSGARFLVLLLHVFLSGVAVDVGAAAVALGTVCAELNGTDALSEGAAGGVLTTLTGAVVAGAAAVAEGTTTAELSLLEGAAGGVLTTLTGAEAEGETEGVAMAMGAIGVTGLMDADAEDEDE